MMKFEAFGESPEFTNLISKFMNDNCAKFELQKDSGEHCISNFMMFKEYSEMVEKALEGFLKKENINEDTFYQACQFAKDENLPCNFLDYVVSSLEYEDFYFLMSDYKTMSTKDVNLDKINEINK